MSTNQYRVHIYSVCHAKLSAPVAATTHQRAAQQIMDQLNAPYGESPFGMEDIFINQSAAEYVQHDESGDIGFLVDRVGDDDFNESCWFSLTPDGEVAPLDDPMRMFTQEEDREIAKLKSLLHDIQHQIDTDSDLDKIAGAEKYKALSKRIKEALEV